MLVDKQQTVDLQSVKASSSDAISSSSQLPQSTVSAAGAARRRDLKPSLMSHISGVHRLSSGVDGGGLTQAGNETSTRLPKYGVDCSNTTLLDEVSRYVQEFPFHHTLICVRTPHAKLHRT